MKITSANSGLNRFKFIMVILTGLICSSLSNGATILSCKKLFEPEIFKLGYERLSEAYSKEIQNLSKAEIQALNEKFLTQVQSHVPPTDGKRAESLTWWEGQSLLNILSDHKVMGLKASDRYQQTIARIGYCFGRAMYLHLTALKMGLQMQSMKKIWAVGSMPADIEGVNWGYHVAFMAYSKKDGWIVLDPTFSSRPLSVERWVERASSKSLDGRMRFYATEASRFGLDVEKYSRLELGLDLPVEKDWFKHFFVDMLSAVRVESLQSLGLNKIDIDDSRIDLKNVYQPKKAKAGFFGQMRDFIGF